MLPINNLEWERWWKCVRPHSDVLTCMSGKFNWFESTAIEFFISEMQCKTWQLISCQTVTTRTAIYYKVKWTHSALAPARFFFLFRFFFSSFYYCCCCLSWYFISFLGSFVYNRELEGSVFIQNASLAALHLSWSSMTDAISRGLLHYNFILALPVFLNT